MIVTRARRLLLVVASCLAAPAVVLGQITFNYDFNGPSGFVGSASNPSYYTTERQAAILRAGTYLSSQFDGRGTVNINLGTQSNAQVGNGTLAVGGTQYFIVSGTATNGTAFGAATTNNAGTSFHTAIDFNSDQTNWFTGSGSSAGSGAFDMQSIALHEITHSLGFSSLFRPDGSGIGGNSTWSQHDTNLRLGNGANAPTLLTGSQGNYAFNSAQVNSSNLSGNNLYFRGEFAAAAFGGAVPLAGGGDRSHLGGAVTNGVMLPGIAAGTDRRAYTNAELGMLIDMGWNQFVWKNSNGNFADNTSSTSNAKWQNLDQDDMLSPVGTITPNTVLRFGGTGGYTATNNLTLAATDATGNDADRFLTTRLILNATAGTSAIAAAGSNVLRFDSTIGVAPQIRQDGAGAFVISHPLELTGRNLELAGNGAGSVTLSGTIGQQTGQTGSILKTGTSTFTLNANNTYTGGTTINGGTLVVGSGGTLGTGAVAINDGGTLGRTGTGSLATGSVTVANNGTLSANIAATGTASQLSLGSNTLDLKTGSRLRLTGLTGFTNTAVGSYTLALLSDGANLLRNGTTVGDGFVYGTFIQGTGNGGSDTVIIDVSGLGFSLTAGDTFTLSRSGNNLVLAFSPVPEPVTVLAVAVAGLGAFSWLRRRPRAAEPTTAA